MYDAILLQEAMAVHGLNPYRLSKRAKVDSKTAARVIETGTGNPDSIYKIAKALGFDVKREGHGRTAVYDLSVIVKRRGALEIPEQEKETPKRKRA